MKNIEDIQKYLESNKVTPFWSATAMVWIRRVMAGNKFFVNSVSNPRIRVSDGYVSRFQCDVTTTIPDSGKKAKARILYTFNPTAASAHYVDISAA